MRISDWSSDVCSSDLTGDVVTLDVPDEGFNAQPVLIKRVEIDPATTKVRFEAETETSSKHAFALGQTTTPPPPVTLTAPDLKPPAPLVGLWDVEGAVTGDGYAAISVAGTIEFPGADSVVVQYRLEGATDWTMAGEFPAIRSEEHTSELQSLMRISYAVFCLKKKTKQQQI